MAARRGKRRKRARASITYTILTLGLIAVAVFLGLTLYGLFSPRPSREGQATVLVLNGCGVQGIGQQTAKLLRSFGLDVIDFRNADSFDYLETIVVDRAGDLDTAAGIARRLGVANVIQQIPQTPLVDVIVIVGADYGEFIEG